MDRLTCRYENTNVLKGQCTFDRLSAEEPDDYIPCSVFCDEQFDGNDPCTNCPIQIAIDRLSEYEDTGLTPDQIKDMDRLYLEKCEELNKVKNIDTLNTSVNKIIDQLEHSNSIEHNKKMAMCQAAFEAYNQACEDVGKAIRGLNNANLSDRIKGLSSQPQRTKLGY